MSHDPNVREIGRVEDIDGVPVIIGVDYGAVTLSGLRLDSAAQEEFGRLFVAATWQAGQQAAAIAEDAEPVPVCYRASCENPILGEPVTDPDDLMGRQFCSEECLTDEAERTHGAMDDPPRPRRRDRRRRESPCPFPSLQNVRDPQGQPVRRGPLR